MTPTCHECKRPLSEGESAWASDVKVVEPGGVRMETRYTCDDCGRDVGLRAEVTA